MNLIVCIKQVPDPEGPQNCFVINAEKMCVEPKGISPVLSPFDENALEAALKIKDACTDNDIKITLISMGKRISDAVMRTALAVGADELVKIEDEAFESSALDSYSTASILASVIKKLGKYDLIFCGREAADWNAGQVGIGIAELIGIPAVTMVRKVVIESNYAVIQRITSEGYEVVKTPLPAVVVASNEVGLMRYPTMPQRKEAKNKPSSSLGIVDMGLEAEVNNKLILNKLFLPEIRKTECELIAGETTLEVAENLIRRLRADRVI